MKNYTSFCLILGLVLSSFFTVNAQDGEAIYKQNCTACHKFGQKLIGPALTSVTTLNVFVVSFSEQMA